MTPKTLERMAEEALWKYTAGGTPYEEEHFKQGYLAGARAALASPEVRAMREAFANALSYLHWNADALSGDDLIGDGRLTARYKQQVSEIEQALAAFFAFSEGAK